MRPEVGMLYLFLFLSMVAFLFCFVFFVYCCSYVLNKFFKKWMWAVQSPN